MPGSTLAAVLIVRNEAEYLPACLDALSGLVDEVVVHDTGSTDATVEIAEHAGVRVERGYWDDDFGRARNAALAATRATWVLSVDADERVVADRDALRSLMVEASGRGTDLLTVRIDNHAPPDLGGHIRTTAPRLLRPATMSWTGRVHERPTRRDGSAARIASCPGDVLSLRHVGYDDAAALQAKSRRNAEIGQVEVDGLLGTHPRDNARLAQVLLDLGRSLVGCARLQQAVDTFEVLRDLAPGSPQAVQGTDALAGVLLAAGHDELVLVLAAQLREAGVAAGYCGWLRAQALAQLGRPAEALELLRGVRDLVDATGRELDLGPVLEVRALTASLVGEPDEALADLVRAMVGHGRIAGRGELLARLWDDRPVSGIAELVRDCAGTVGDGAVPERIIAVAAELALSPPPGPELAGVLAQLLATAGLTAAAGLPIGPACAG